MIFPRYLILFLNKLIFNRLININGLST